ncbi:hypothetical protein MCUN1_001007 [Malassezia cuniculi]|uniref:Protein SMG7 n=1 Tax=Malassezia cuniculi TaxID=948313 RepID=A0AAF0J5K6_9BASI|nr:hypothetical protein MCUN1_001007 [Malassezia cuniculi]
MEGDSSASPSRASQLRNNVRTQKRELEHAINSVTGPKPAPLDSAVRHARTALRDTLMSFLLTCTFDKYTPTAETLLWTDTTYSQISIFRSVLARVESEEDEKKRTHIYRHVLRDLRRFLDKEYHFWTHLAGKLVRLYAIDEARDVLAEVGITVGAGGHGHSHRDASDTSHDRDGILPSMEERVALVTDSANRDRVTLLIARTLICCGDIVRYKEQYASPPVLQGKGTSEVPLSTPNYEAPAAYYHASAKLYPASGSPENQLAVLATYRSDKFGALFHYMGAFLAPMPFDNARFNFRRIISQELPKWQRSEVRNAILGEWKHAALASAAGAPTHVPMRRLSVSGAEWLTLLVDLHALLACNSELDCAAALDNALRDTVLVLAEDSLRAVDFVRAVVVAIRAESMPRNGEPLGDAAEPALAIGTLSLKLSARVPTLARLMRIGHFLGLVTALAAVCRHTIAAKKPLRTLASLRLALKWVRHEMSHVHSSAQATAQLAATTAVGDVSAAAADPDARFAAIVHDLPGRFTAFWSAYDALVDALTHAYPAVPHVHTKLPEDQLLVPLGVASSGHAADSDDARIGDLLADADAVRLSPLSPLAPTGEDDDPVDSAMRAFETLREEHPNNEHLQKEYLHSEQLQKELPHKNYLHSDYLQEERPHKEHAHKEHAHKEHKANASDLLKHVLSGNPKAVPLAAAGSPASAPAPLSHAPHTPRMPYNHHLQPYHLQPHHVQPNQILPGQLQPGQLVKPDQLQRLTQYAQQAQHQPNPGWPSPWAPQGSQWPEAWPNQPSVLFGAGSHSSIWSNSHDPWPHPS